ncbi:molecular chaperone [Mixta mediterraneensis]|uniref:fimbrial biogenesis chaperone n=1 Tax=Mixta mediterraneensis TaxID=2758443 RepID=UPI00187506FF|nr:molecular chaperone [Mixta mediterraneensis]MBE5254595.1 molecular chaperone [Mixta mediterraneensis]
MSSVLPLWRHALVCMLCASLALPGAMASGLQVSPVSLTLPGTQNADGIWLSNEGSREINAQVRVYRWSQNNFSDELSPSHGLVISPPMLALRPGERQLIRVIRTRPSSGEREEAYRLSVNELPPAVMEKNRLQFVLHYSLPVFIQPATTGPLSADLRWNISRTEKGVFLDVHNQGNSHAQLSAATLVTSRGVRRAITPGLLGYVLPASTMRWVLPVTTVDAAQGGKLEITINGQKTEQTL